MISLNPGSYETRNDFFTKFKHLVLQLKQCKVEKEDDQLIPDILSKLGPDWKIPSLDAFIKTLINEHENLVQMGILKSSKDQALFSSG